RSLGGVRRVARDDEAPLVARRSGVRCARTRRAVARRVDRRGAMSAPKPDFRALGEAIAREEDAILARHPGAAEFRGGRRPWRVPVAIGIALAGAAIAVIAARPRPLTVSVDGRVEDGSRWISATHDAPLPIHFSDGTEVVLAPEANARVVDVTPRGAHV